MKGTAVVKVKDESGIKHTIPRTSIEDTRRQMDRSIVFVNKNGDRVKALSEKDIEYTIIY